MTLAFTTCERCMKGNSWCSYLALNPNQDLDMPQLDYIKNIAGPAYRKMMEEEGGKDSLAWTKKKEELIRQHKEMKVKQVELSHTKKMDKSNSMKLLLNQCRWDKDMNTAKICGVHIVVIMVSGDPSMAGKNRFLFNSDFAKSYIVKCLGTPAVF